MGLSKVFACEGSINQLCKVNQAHFAKSWMLTAPGICTKSVYKHYSHEKDISSY
jgi:hypothetical protein